MTSIINRQIEERKILTVTASEMVFSETARGIVAAGVLALVVVVVGRPWTAGEDLEDCNNGLAPTLRLPMARLDA